jgi:hypothetical protein
MDEVTAKLPSLGDFAGQMNSTFHFSSDTLAPFDTELVEAEQTMSNAIQSSFSLLFRAPGDTQSVQSLYNVSHPVLGEMLLFVVPVKQNDEGLFFEAVFNKLLLK